MDPLNEHVKDDTIMLSSIGSYENQNAKCSNKKAFILSHTENISHLSTSNIFLPRIWHLLWSENNHST